MSENQFMRPMPKAPDEKPWGSAPRSKPQEPMTAPEQEEMQLRLVYPEIFYKLQPYIIAVCDEMDTFGDEMPSLEMIERICDSIYNDIREMHPDLADYINSSEPTVETQVPFGRSRVSRRFRRRGLFRDLIEILLLSELARRRRRRRYY